ncbi:hypothetical protein [Kitasatospora sp. MAA4]|uniref:restriction endonuclease-related protein n=1 Tax=Kitasatospora sp. MAA4 TaxID=3035093 RepID=UPI00247513D0|nr:hypothetical protein [Kitasatospora sp. MAA4]
MRRAAVPVDAVRRSRLQQVSTDLADDYATIQLLAAGLARIRINQQRALWSTPESAGTAVGLPAAWNAGVTRLLWRLLESGHRTMPSHAEVLRWCQLPLAQWPVQLHLAPSDGGLLLIEDGQPSAFTDEAARIVLSKDPEAELVEQGAFELLMTVADRNTGNPQDTYVYLRGFLVDHAIATDLDLLDLIRRFPARDAHGVPWAKQWFTHSYRPVATDGTHTFVVCNECGNPLAEGTTCGTPGCACSPALRTVKAITECFVQHRAVRRFHHDPGLCEMRVFAALEPVLGERLHRWWGMDAVDAAVDFDGTGTMGTGLWWAADVKDHASASMLGGNFRWDARANAARRFLVVAQHQAERPDYMDDLATAIEGRAKGVEIISEDAFIEAVLAHERARRHP